MDSQTNLYQMFDTRAMQPLGPIFGVRAEGAAIRNFTDVLAQPDTLPGQHPEDFVLLHLGTQNDETGALTPAEPRPAFHGRTWQEMRQAATSAAQDPPRPNKQASQEESEQAP